MFRLTSIIFVAYVLQLSGMNAEVVMVFEDFAFPFVDETYFLEPDSYIADDNSMVLNVTVVKRLPDHALARMNLLGLLQGQYVISSGIDIEMELCEMIGETFIMGPLMQVFGIARDRCPPEPGLYGSVDKEYVKDTTNFPDTFPRNKYLSIFTINDEDHNIMTAHIFVDLQ